MVAVRYHTCRATSDVLGAVYLSGVLEHGAEGLNPDTTELAPSHGRLVLADGVGFAASLPAGSVDLVYLDPPFGTGAGRKFLRGRGGRFGLGEGQAYADPKAPSEAETLHPFGWRGGTNNALPLWLQEFCQQSHRVLAETGMFFLHLDWRLAHHARIYLDELFGPDRFLNEIIWHYATGGIPTRWLARKHDTILFYAKGPKHNFHRRQEKKYLAHKMSRKGVPEFKDKRGWYRFRYLDDVWNIPWLTPDSKERTGYPTQKPIRLLERIFDIASDPGDTVADFCCGSGTLAAAAAGVGRNWICSDRSEQAIQVVQDRLVAQGLKIVESGSSSDVSSPTRSFTMEDWLKDLARPGADT